MFDEPNEQPAEAAADPAQRAREKADEFRMHAELAAVFEACRKFDARLLSGVDAQVARDVQRAMAKLEKSRSPESPVLPPESMQDAAALLDFAHAHELSTNDYHIHRRPGELMIARWLEGEQVDVYYQRMQAHFDAALEGYKEDERQAHEWKQDAQTRSYLDALEKVQVQTAERYLREIIRKNGIFVLSTQTIDEINIAYLTDHIMGIAAVDLVGRAAAPPDEPEEQDLAWFFKLFSLRGVIGAEERMCFFTYMQKSDETF